MVVFKALVSAICIGSGGSVGREGPIVQIGAAWGSTFGRLLRIREHHLKTLVACGAAAGTAATFNAPILKAKHGKEEALLKELIKMVEPSRAELGCIQNILHKPTVEKGTFVFYETCKDEESLNRHLETKHYKEYKQNIENLLNVREVYRLQSLVQVNQNELQRTNLH